MFHTQDEWRVDEGVDVVRALSDEPTRQRFSVVQVFTNTPTYEVWIAYLDAEGEHCWRRFLCTLISKVIELVLGDDVVVAKVTISSVGIVKNLSLGETILEIFEYTKNSEPAIFFCVTSGGISLSDKIDNIGARIPDSAISVWRN